MFVRKKPEPKPDPEQRVSIERDGKVVFQITAANAKFIYENFGGQWAPYKAHISGKMVTAYQITEGGKVYTNRTNYGERTKLNYHFPLFKGDMVYSDDSIVSTP